MTDITRAQALDIQDAVKRQHEARTRLLSASTHGTRATHAADYIDATASLAGVVDRIRGHRQPIKTTVPTLDATDQA